MAKTILIHSFYNGVGRSNIAANLAYLLATTKHRVAIIDTDTKSPAIHSLFGVHLSNFQYSFNDYLGGKCQIEQAAYDITASLRAKINGQVYLIPANLNAADTVRTLKNPQDVTLLNTGCERLINHFNLDALLVDTQPGVSKEALVSMTVADTLIIILRLNPGDYQGTGVTVDVVRQLDVPQIALIVNEAPTSFDFDEIKAEMEQFYGCEVIAILPHIDEMMALANNDIFARRYPNHPASTTLNNAVAKIIT